MQNSHRRTGHGHTGKVRTGESRRGARVAGGGVAGGGAAGGDDAKMAGREAMARWTLWTLNQVMRRYCVRAHGVVTTRRLWPSTPGTI